VKGAAGAGIGGEEGDKVLVAAREGTGDANAIACELPGAIYIVCDLRSCETSDRTSTAWGCLRGSLGE
jgi:NAD(P)-dependent dehydrogenase (short-subunit alcohol dehydrogenase family)